MGVIAVLYMFQRVGVRIKQANIWRVQKSVWHIESARQAFLLREVFIILLLFTGYCSDAKLWPTLCDPMDYSSPDFPVLHYLPEFAQIHVH